MKHHGLVHAVRSDVIKSSRNLVSIRVRSIITLAQFSSQARVQAPQSLPSSSVILPHEELKIKLVRARQEKVAKLQRNASSSQDHHDLDSYMRAHRVKLSQYFTDEKKRHALNTNYVHLGTRYEYLIQKHLVHELGFSITQVGGKGDGGVDLIGTWTLPKTADQRPSGKSATFKVYVQAKRYAPHRKPMPSLMREVEGTLMSAPDSPLLKEAFANHMARVGNSKQLDLPQSYDIYDQEVSELMNLTKCDDMEDLGILVTTQPFPSGIEKAMRNSRKCLMYIQLEEHPFEMPKKASKVSQEVLVGLDDQDHLQLQHDMSAQSSTTLDYGGTSMPMTKIRQIVWNEAATKAGLVGYDVITQHDSMATSDESGHERAMLVYQQMTLKV